MFCPTCQTVVWAALETCPTCGGTMREVEAGDAVDVVEATAEIGTGEPAAGLDASGVPDPLAVAATSERMALPVSVRLAELTFAAWRQPAVRAAVKTGASALALSLAMRAARHALLRPSTRRVVLRPVLPTLSDLLPSEADARRERGPVVIETFVYVRRVVRH